jgi:hypothetical protein
MQAVLRTPPKRVASLPDFPYEANYSGDWAGFDGLRLHHLGTGRPETTVFLCLPGQPIRSYRNRKMIPILAAADGAGLWRAWFRGRKKAARRRRAAGRLVRIASVGRKGHHSRGR